MFNSSSHRFSVCASKVFKTSASGNQRLPCFPLCTHNSSSPSVSFADRDPRLFQPPSSLSSCDHVLPQTEQLATSLFSEPLSSPFPKLQPPSSLAYQSPCPWSFRLLLPPSKLYPSNSRPFSLHLLPPSSKLRPFESSAPSASLLLTTTNNAPGLPLFTSDHHHQNSDAWNHRPQAPLYLLPPPPTHLLRTQPNTLQNSTQPSSSPSYLCCTIEMKATLILFALVVVVIVWAKHAMSDIEDRLWECAIDFLLEWVGRHDMSLVRRRFRRCLVDFLWTSAIAVLVVAAFFLQLTFDIIRHNPRQSALPWNRTSAFIDPGLCLATNLHHISSLAVCFTIMITPSSGSESDSRSSPPPPSMLRRPRPATPVMSPGTPIQGVSFVAETPPSSENDRYPPISPSVHLQQPFNSNPPTPKRRRVGYARRGPDVNTLINLANHEVLIQAENPYYMKAIEDVASLRVRVQELEVENRTLRYAFEHVSNLLACPKRQPSPSMQPPLASLTL
ncbi:hypothetical protein BDN72DRAFT_900752 [Pluteus cervinus]|uniref:Uncharacterized protein n=1 Tax=Pluteus cervinus TaxID=181527 RepID=A0ACD3AHX1_9AGAR|nr:hypothetical protein BDN72DRAFT_900752 [Pluteus cervinus]